MEYYAIKFLAAAKCDINTKNFYEKISSGLNFCLRLNKKTQELHTTNKYKGYCFYIREYLPIKMGQLFHLIVRCYGDELHKLLTEALLQKDNAYFFCQKIEADRKFEYSNFVKKLAIKTVSPVVITPLGYNFDDKEEIIRRLGDNIEKKYNSITNEQVNHNPICDVKVVGNVPCVADYKESHIAGRKIIVKFKKDELSQKMAFLAMAYGLGEKNALGFGTCFANNEYLYEF